jgi:hypothetical protein
MPPEEERLVPCMVQQFHQRVCSFAFIRFNEEYTR